MFRKNESNMHFDLNTCMQTKKPCYSKIKTDNTINIINLSKNTTKLNKCLDLIIFFNLFLLLLVFCNNISAPKILVSE